MLKGAIFDHDGLMFDTETIWQANWQKAALKRNVTLPEEFKFDICGTSGQLMLNVIQKYFHVTDGTEIKDEVVAGVHHDEAIHIEPKEGLFEIIKFFHENGVKMAVASSSPKEMIIRNLDNGGITSYFDAVVSGLEVENGKPAPDIFLKAAEKIGMNPEECYVFEDAYNGVRAGSSAGCRTIMIPDLVAPNDEMENLAYCICPSLLDVKKRIENGEF